MTDMTELVQQLIVAASIAAAALYVGRRSWLTLRGRSGGCGIGCNSCPSAKNNEPAIIELSDFNSPNR